MFLTWMRQNSPDSLLLVSGVCLIGAGLVGLQNGLRTGSWTETVVPAALGVLGLLGFSVALVRLRQKHNRQDDEHPNAGG